MIKAVFFDFDETLQDRTAAFERYMDGFFARFFPGNWRRKSTKCAKAATAAMWIG